MKKKLVAVMLGIMMSFALAGCGDKTTESAVATETEMVTEAVTEELTEVVEEVTETEEPTEVVEEVTEVPESTEVVEVSPYTYTDLSQTLYAQSTVNVRDLPEQTGAKVGSLTTNQEVTVTGQCNETGWYRISYNGGEGFVSNSYLGSEKVKSQSTASSNSGESTKSESASQSSQSTAASQAASAPAETPATQPAETPATPSADSGSNVVSGRSSDDYTFEEQTSITPDSYICPICGFETTNAEEYDAHLAAEGVQ